MIWLFSISLQWNRTVDFKTTSGLHIAKSNSHISIFPLFDLQRALDTVITPCCRLHICVSPKFICWNLMPNMTVLGGGAFGRFLGHEGRDILDEISALYKRLHRMSNPFHHMRTQREVDSLRRGRSPEFNHSSILILDFKPPELWEINFHIL